MRPRQALRAAALVANAPRRVRDDGDNTKLCYLSYHCTVSRMTIATTDGATTMTGTSATARIGEFCEVSGQRLWLLAAANAGPAVVFLPAASNVGLDYLNIHNQISGFATSVLYDRGGTGWSDPQPLPRTAGEVATELRGLLTAAAVPGPYVLVAHSLGGAYARRFGQLFPADVAGVVALDAFHEDWDDYLPPRLHLAAVKQPDPGPLQYKLIRPVIARMYRKMLAGWPD